ncbi:hypothetical protein ACPPVV_09440 [Rhodanobacter sp. Col0626]|uniref:hypothetical protein n=1 Tax=Rhodanobacter sp. Col0626 TaxID=3415679 RepID=UPI003CEE5D40
MSLENAENENRQNVEVLQRRVDAIQGAANEAGVKYAYFLLAAAGACLGYGLQKLDGQPRSYETILAFLAYVLWMSSILFGCLGLQNFHTELSFSHRVLEIDLKGAQSWARSSAEKSFDAMAKPAMEKWATGARVAHWWQRRAQFYCLILGVLCFAIWRVWLWWATTKA